METEPGKPVVLEFWRLGRKPEAPKLSTPSPPTLTALSACPSARVSRIGSEWTPAFESMKRSLRNVFSPQQIRPGRAMGRGGGAGREGTAVGSKLPPLLSRFQSRRDPHVVHTCSKLVAKAGGGPRQSPQIHGPSCNFDLKKRDAAMLASKVFGLNLPKIRKAASKFPPMLREGRELGACWVALPIQIIRLRTHDQVAHALHATCVSCSSGVCSCFVHSVLSRPMRGSLQFASYCISLYRVTSWRLPRKTLRLRFTRLVRFGQNSV